MEYASKGPIMEYDEDEELFRINPYFRNDINNKQDYTEDELREHISNILKGLEYCNNIITKCIQKEFFIGILNQITSSLMKMVLQKYVKII